MMKPHLTTALFLTVTALLYFPADAAFAYTLRKAGSGDTIRWNESCFHYSVNENGAPDVDIDTLRDAVRVSFDAWENVECNYFYFVETDDATCDKIGYNQNVGNMNLLVFRESGWAVDKEHDPHAIALTTTSWDDLSGRMLDADIEFNAENFDFGTTGNTAAADIQNTATHEIGHMLGLDHSTVVESTMAPTADTGDTDKRTLTQDDIDGLCALYPVEDDPDICMPPHCGLDLSCTSEVCNKAGIAYIDTTDPNSCAVVTHPGASESPAVVTLLRLLTTLSL